jgi:hypothetical protein
MYVTNDRHFSLGVYNLLSQIACEARCSRRSLLYSQCLPLACSALIRRMDYDAQKETQYAA